MKIFIAALFASALLSLAADAQTNLAEHVYFKHLLGKWHGEGKLQGENGNEVSFSSDWEGKATPEGSFVMEGQRVINDDKQTFRWVITHNPVTDAYEALMTTNGDEAGALRFEAHVSDVTLTMDYRASIGTSGSVTLQDTFGSDDKTILNSQVTMLGDAGNTTLSGTITHTKVKE